MLEYGGLGQTVFPTKYRPIAPLFIALGAFMLWVRQGQDRTVAVEQGRACTTAGPLRHWTGGSIEMLQSI